MPESPPSLFGYQSQGPSLADKAKDFLGTSERGLSRLFGFGDTLNYASQRPAELGYKDDNRGQGDALRHLLLSGELHRQYPGWLAKAILYGHEYGTNVLQGQSLDDRAQDLYNNEIGRQIGGISQSRPDVERRAVETIRSNKAQVLSVKQDY